MTRTGHGSARAEGPETTRASPEVSSPAAGPSHVTGTRARYAVWLSAKRGCVCSWSVGTASCHRCSALGRAIAPLQTDLAKKLIVPIVEYTIVYEVERDPITDKRKQKLELTRFVGHLILGVVQGKEALDGSSSEVSRGVPA